MHRTTFGLWTQFDWKIGSRLGDELQYRMDASWLRRTIIRAVRRVTE